MQGKLHTLRKYRQCVGKKWRLSNRSDAEEIALVIFNESGNVHQLDVYACPFCGLYHLGHTPITRQGQRERARLRAAQTQSTPSDH